MHEVMALCAPRPLFNYSAKKDEVYFPTTVHQKDDYSNWWQTIDMALNQVSNLYDILGVPENFIRVDKDGGHDFPPDVREEAYHWMDKQLGIR